MAKRIYRRVAVLPSLLTLGNFACGFFSIVFALNSLFFVTRAQMMEESGASVVISAPAPDMPQLTRQQAYTQSLHSAGGSMSRSTYLLQWACAIVFIGMLFDVLDGRVARMMDAASAFGKELDSLADVTTFGVAPPVIVNALWISVMPVQSAWFGQVLVFGAIYACCGVLRLARYNIISATEDKNIFRGLPIPAAAGCVVTAVLVAYGDYPAFERVCAWLDSLIGPGMNAFQVKVNLLALFLIIPGLLMVSNIPFTHLANRYFSGKKSFTILVIAVILLAMVWHEPRLTMFCCFNGYMVWGLIAAARKHWGGQKEPIMDPVDDDDSAQETQDA